MKNATQEEQARSDTFMLPAALLRGMGTVVVFGLLIFALVLLGLREVVFPRVDDYREDVLAYLSERVGEPVEADRIHAGWDGLRPRLVFEQLSVGEAIDEGALQAARLEGVLGWSSLLRGQPYFHRLQLEAPEVAAERTSDGRLLLGGVELKAGDGEAVALRWLFDQGEVIVRDAEVSWRDGKRAEPAQRLRAESLNFRLKRVGGRYRFGLNTRVPAFAGEPLELRGDLVSRQPADMKSWAGQMYAQVGMADLNALAPWLDYPVPLSGWGSARLWLDVREGHWQSMQGDVALDEASVRLDDDLPVLKLSSLAGRLRAEHEDGLSSFRLQLHELFRDELFVVDAVELALKVDEARRLRSAAFRTPSLDLASWSYLLRHTPLPAAVRGLHADLAPAGRLEDLDLEWRGRAGGGSPEWHASGRFIDIEFGQTGLIPGVQGVSGEFEGGPGRGRFQVRGEGAVIDMPAVFPEPQLVFSSIRGEGGWRQENGDWTIMVDNVAFENPDAAGSAQGVYYPVPGERGSLDINAALHRADVTAVWRYLPWVVDERARLWLRESLVGAQVSEASLVLSGDLEQFPFEHADSGVFHVDVGFVAGTLHYAKGWPDIKHIDGRVRFEHAGLRVEASQARLFGARLDDVVAEIPDLGADDGAVLTVSGRGQGATADFLRFVSESPLEIGARDFIGGIEAEGDGRLDIELTLPLRDLPSTQVQGAFEFADNQLQLLPWLPQVQAASGRVEITEEGVTIPAAEGRTLGRSVAVSAETVAPRHVAVRARGGMSADGLQAWQDFSPLKHVSGVTNWQADVEVREGLTRISVESDLDGLEVALPAPLRKTAEARWPLRVQAELAPGGGRYELSGRLGELAALELTGVRRDDGWAVAQGGLGLQATPEGASGGLMVTAAFDTFDADQWLQVLDADRLDKGRSFGPVVGWDVAVKRFKVFERDVHDLEIGAVATADGWSGQLDSEMASGRFDWAGDGHGALSLRLTHLDLGLEGSDGRDMFAAQSERRLPDVDIHAERFSLREMELGELRLIARNEGGVWRMDEVGLQTAESRLKGQGVWRTGEESATELDLDLRTSDAARLLQRLEQPEAVDASAVRLHGRVGWAGMPTQLDFPSLQGRLELESGSGRFRQLEPGVGRLLGVLSLQALPRRLQLDFSDVFSEGFAFDSVSGSIDLASGQAHSDDLHIVGPAAQVWINGSANLVRETQNLTVVVHPTLSESVAVGAAAGLINPVAGVIAYLAQRVLRDPIEQMFAYGYRITGTWSEPRVDALPVGAQRQSRERGSQREQ